MIFFILFVLVVFSLVDLFAIVIQRCGGVADMGNFRHLLTPDLQAVNGRLTN